jgi:hypothetical protein
MTSAHPAGEGLEPVLRDQGIEEAQQQREVLYRDPAQAWIYIGSGGSGWCWRSPEVAFCDHQNSR